MTYRMDESNSSTTEHALHQVIQTQGVIAAVRCFIAVLAIILNGGLVVAFLVQKVRRPSVNVSPSGLLVLNVLIADALQGGVVLLNLASASTFMDTSTTWCIARISVSFLVLIGCHIAVVNVVVDRYVAVVHPFKYRDWMTWRRTVIMATIGWFVPLAGAVAVATSEDPHIQVPRCRDIHGYTSFLWSVWIPAHIIANVTIILIQCRMYSFLKRRDAENGNQLSSSDKFEWILLRITMPTYIAMLLMYVMKILVVVTGDVIVASIYPITLMVVQMWFLMNPLVFAYATDNIRKPVADLFRDIRKRLCPAKEPASAPPNMCMIQVEKTPAA